MGGNILTLPYKGLIRIYQNSHGAVVKALVLDVGAHSIPEGGKQSHRGWLTGLLQSREKNEYL